MTSIELREELREKLQAVIAEYGIDSIKKAVIIGPYDKKQVAGIPCVHAPTLGWHVLGNVEFKVARYFEDLSLLKG